MFDDLKRQGYFGFVFTAPLFQGLSALLNLAIRFVKNDQNDHIEDLETRVIRPMIEVDDKALDGLSFENNELTANLQLRYSGYGNVYGKIIVSDDKEKLYLDVKDAQDLYLIMANCKTFKEFMAHNGIDEQEFIGAKIPEDQYEYRKLLLEISQMGEFTAGAFFDAMKTVIANKKLQEILDRTIEQSTDVTMNFFRSILDLVEKRPVEGVFLSDAKIAPVVLSEGKNTVFLYVMYVDDFGNFYTENREIKIGLNRKRTIYFGSKWTEKAGNWNWLKNP